MGLISPNLPSVKNVDTKEKRKLFDAALIDYGLRETQDEQGRIIRNVQRLAATVWEGALYSESPKDRALFAKLLYERVGGKPTVIAEEEHEEIPEIVLRVNPKSAEQIKQLAERDDVTEDDSESRVVVDIEGEEGQMEF